MSFHLDMLHRSLPAWEYQPTPTRADWVTFVTVLVGICGVYMLAMVGWFRCH